MEFVRDKMKIYCRFKNFFNIMNHMKLVLFVHSVPCICLQSSEMSRQQFSCVIMFRFNRSLKNPNMQQVSFQGYYCRRNTQKDSEYYSPITKQNVREFFVAQQHLRQKSQAMSISDRKRLVSISDSRFGFQQKQDIVNERQISGKCSACSGILHDWFSNLFPFLLLQVQFPSQPLFGLLEAFRDGPNNGLKGTSSV